MVYFLYPLRSISAKFDLAAVVSHVLETDEAKRDDFDLKHYNDLTCSLFIFFYYIETTLCWELFILAPGSATGSQVMTGSTDKTAGCRLSENTPSRRRKSVSV